MMNGKGKYGWLGLAIYVLLWDNLVQETLSDAYWRAVEKKQWWVVAIWAALISHLFFRTPFPLRFMILSEKKGE